MIAFVRGPVAAIGLDSCVIEVGGVGLQLFCHPGTLATLRPGQEFKLATSMVVREDSLTLYGFADADEKELFELLQTASGVGPKLAQAALAVLSPDQLNTYDVLFSDEVVFTTDALEAFLGEPARKLSSTQEATR